jgi:hypothetical protein
MNRNSTIDSNCEGKKKSLDFNSEFKISLTLVVKIRNQLQEVPLIKDFPIVSRALLNFPLKT